MSDDREVTIASFYNQLDKVEALIGRLIDVADEMNHDHECDMDGTQRYMSRAYDNLGNAKNQFRTHVVNRRGGSKTDREYERDLS